MSKPRLTTAQAVEVIPAWLRSATGCYDALGHHWTFLVRRRINPMAWFWGVARLGMGR